MWDLDKVRKIKEQTDTISPTFCAMKWLHTTLHLHIGHTHSCYLPDSHQIPLHEIEVNPSALHNTRYKKQQRKKMLNGERPSECSICWQTEDLQKDAISDRLRGNAKKFAKDSLEEIAETPWNANINPKYLEVNFGNSCNLNCGYCCPAISTKWTEEIKRYGEFNLSNDYYNIHHLDSPNYYGPKDDNPYIDAFWKWWPSVKRELHTLRITGGEPLMNPSAMRMFKLLEEQPAPNLELAVNTNLAVSDNKVNAFFEQLKNLQDNNCVKRILINTSVEGIGSQAEYMRTGMNYSKWENNLVKALDYGFDVMIMSTFNVLCVATYDAMIEKIIDLRGTYSLDQLQWTNSILHKPWHWSPAIVSQNMHHHFDRYLNTMSSKKVVDIERQHMLQISNFVKKSFDKDKLATARNDFVKFFGENDKRNATNIFSVFPEYIGEVAEWSKAAPC